MIARIKHRIKKMLPWLPSVTRKIRMSVLALINDRLYIIIQFVFRMGRFPNLRKPSRFTDKLQWMKIHGDMEVLFPYVDKLLVRSYVKKTIHEDILVPIIEIWQSTTEVNFDRLPSSFVLKASHGSGFNLLVKDKTKLHKADTLNMLDAWLEINYYLLGREPQYKYCPKRIFAEQLLDLDKQYYDYKIFCANGDPQIIQVLGYDSKHSIKGAHFSPTWEQLNINRYDIANIPERIEAPEELDLLLKYAKELSRPFPFVRVDFYLCNGKVYFGELTFTPTNGMIKFVPDQLDYSFCSRFKVPQKVQDLHD